jgi:2-polyprenyl-3-methyl-5-hydroxy-6-metoxy-1,4-benzoquinol methylase
MKKIKIKFEDQSKKWNIWKNKSGIERSIQRVKGILPEMECAKQLTQIVKKIYNKGNTVLDFGCAAGHFYYSLKKIDKNIKYSGFDVTKSYINFAKKHFNHEKNVNFDKQNIFFPSKKYKNKFDIVFCSNVLLHLPSIDLPLKNLLFCTKKYCIIRTLVSENTHLSKFYHNDKTNKHNVLDSFQFQNTYSYNLIRKKIKKIGNYNVRFLDDKYNGYKINKEYKKYNKKYPGLTKFIQNIQISGSKVFEWKWIVIRK